MSYLSEGERCSTPSDVARARPRRVEELFGPEPPTAVLRVHVDDFDAVFDEGLRDRPKITSARGRGVRGRTAPTALIDKLAHASHGH
jgi:hypothetical protein